MRVVKKKRRGGEEEKWKERKAVDERHGEEGATETSRFVFFSFSRRNLHLRSIFYDPMANFTCIAFILSGHEYSKIHRFLYRLNFPKLI